MKREKKFLYFVADGKRCDRDDGRREVDCEEGVTGGWEDDCISRAGNAMYVRHG